MGGGQKFAARGPVRKYRPGYTDYAIPPIRFEM